MLRIRSGWLLPVASAPIADGAVLIDDSGRIEACGQDMEVVHPETAMEIRLGHDVALLPGMVNSHTHLELTGSTVDADPTDFRGWLLAIRELNSRRDEVEQYEATCRGIESMWAQGVTTVADTGSSGLVAAALDALGASGIAYHEVFGPDPAQCTASINRFSVDLDRLARHATGRVSLGVSPHAPYTVSGELYRATMAVARAHGVPTAIHIAEPAAERELLDDFSGYFAEAFRERNIARPTHTPISPIGHVEALGVLGNRTLCIHAIDVDEADAQLILHHGAAIAHCPRSNRVHHHRDAPVRRYIELGLRVGLGTDSEASVAPADLRAEAGAASELTGWQPREAIRALTLGGAEALGLDTELGSIEPGKWADLVAVRIADGDDVAGSVLAGGEASVLATWLGGREVYRASFADRG